MDQPPAKTTDEARAREDQVFRAMLPQFGPADFVAGQASMNYAPWLSSARLLSEEHTIVGQLSTGREAGLEHEGNVLMGFLPYKGPAEKVRLVFAFQQAEWLDCRVWTAWPGLKQAQAGTAAAPTGCLPLLWDETLKTPSGKRHPLSEWIAADFYAAAKYGMMGETPSDLAAILLLRDLQLCIAWQAGTPQVDWTKIRIGPSHPSPRVVGVVLLTQNRDNAGLRIKSPGSLPHPTRPALVAAQPVKRTAQPGACSSVASRQPPRT